MCSFRIRAFMLSFFILSASIGFCAGQDFKSQDELGRWLTGYYQKPEPERISPALKYLSDTPLIESNAVMPTVAFFSALLKKDNAILKSVFDDVALNGSENAKVMLVNVLSLMNTPESKALLEEARNTWESQRLQAIVKQQITKPHPSLDTAPIDSPQVLDMLWGTFFATGDEAPVKKIISVIHLEKDGHEGEIMLGGAANWSLASNARQYPRVLEICKKEAVAAQGPTKELLEKIIKGASVAK